MNRDLFQVGAEWVATDQQAAEALCHVLMRLGAETAGSGPLDSLCPCCGHNRRTDAALLALVEERLAGDGGRRFTLEQVAEMSGIDLDELRHEIAEEEAP